MIIEKRRAEIIARMEADGALSPTCKRCEPSYRYEDPCDGTTRYGTHLAHEADQRAAAQDDARGEADR